MLFRNACIASAAAIVSATPVLAVPLSATFTYQGQLVLDGTPVNGAADLRFQLYNAAAGGSAVGALSEHLNQPVNGGLFTVDAVNVGSADVFDGDELWVEISARVPAGGGAWLPLSPRQRLAPTPYAIHSMRPWITDGNDIYFDGARVGIGTDSPAYRLDVRSPTPRAIFGMVTNATGNTQGVFGQSDSDGGEGVMGWATANTGTTSGVYGQSDSSAGRGVYGLAANSSGTNYGAYGEARGSDGSGVFGLATSNNAGAIADGVRGQSNTVFGSGVYGVANHATGNTYGVRGSVASPNGYAGFFEGRGKFTGRLGVGPTPVLDGPLARLHVVTNSIGLVNNALQNDDLVVEDTDARINLFSTGDGSGGSAIAFAEADSVFGDLVNKWTIIRETAAGGSGNGLRFTYGTSTDPFANPTRVYFGDDGRVGIGTLAPNMELTVAGSSYITDNVGIGNSSPEVKLHIMGGTDASLIDGGYIVCGSTNNLNVVIDNNEIMARNDYQAANLTLNHQGGDVIIAPQGNTRVRVLEITGADLAEKFPASEELKPGMVTAIDPANPGKLCLARGAYNHGVAGVVSGANNFSVGAVLGNLPGHEDAPPIALSGRVYVWCDATEHAINPTDLLTTSDTPGHAMKVLDHAKAQGAVLGKAMTGLSKGEKGMVLVLVNLQ
jgi:hypothetical protein